MHRIQFFITSLGIALTAIGATAHELGVAYLPTELLNVPGAQALLTHPALAFLAGAALLLFGMMERRPSYPVR